MTEEQLIDDVFRKEGDRYGDQTTKPPIDQPTARGGITLGVATEYAAAHGLPAPTVQTLKDMTHSQARLIVQWKLRQLASRYRFDRIAFDPLRLQMIDFAYNSGPALAIRWLQRVLQTKRTGVMDRATLALLEHTEPFLVHQALIAARLQMIDMATDPGGSVDARFEEGLENRALTFSLLAIP